MTSSVACGIGRIAVIRTRLRGGRNASVRGLPLAGALVAAVLVGFILLRFPPSEYGFYPRCPIEQLLHIQCPGCGSTRALAALLRGDLSEALRLNALTTVALPMLALYGVYRAICFQLDRAVPVLRVPQPVLYCGFILVAVFGVFRNL